MAKSAREIALKILTEINQNGAYSNISIRRNIDYSVGSLDDSFIRELVYGVLENKLFIDWIIAKYSKTKIGKISPIILDILRLGVYQLMFMDRIPDSASVNESVNLAKRFSHRGTHGFVNGILRNIIRDKDNIELPDKDKEPVEYLSIKYSHPKWMVEKWIDEFGFDFTESLCFANNTKPKLNIRVNTLKITREKLIANLREKGLIVSETKYADDGITIDNPIKITELEEFQKGYFQIQDESSMLVAQVMNPLEGSVVMDVCSAPGGKTTHIAQKMKNKGRIIARDIYDHKLKLIEDNAKRLGINIIETENYNALELDETLIEKIDYCLVDAPCSGLGLLRRKPDIRWNKNEDNWKEIAKLQYSILENASKYLKKQGVLIYSTCTIEKEENIKIVKKFLSENDGFHLEEFKNQIDNSELSNSSLNGYIELFPNTHDTDGFFIAKIIKK